MYFRIFMFLLNEKKTLKIICDDLSTVFYLAGNMVTKSKS